MSVSAVASRSSSHRFLDFTAMALAFPLACELYERLARPSAWLLPMDVLWYGFAVSVLTWTVSAWFTQLYGERFAPSTLDEVARVVRTAVTSGLAVAAIGFFTKQTHLSRLLIGTYFVLFTTMMLAVRAALRASRRGASRHYAIVGAGGIAREVVEAIESHPEWRMQLAGFISLDRQAHGSRGAYLGPLSQLDRILEEEVIDVVVFAVPRERLGEVERAVHICEELGVEVRISLDILRFGPGRMMVSDLDGVPMLSFTRTPVDALALGLKRAFDVLMSAAVIVLLAPLFGAIAVAIRFDSPGPIFFRQRRVGQNGRVFDMVKFRSMYRDAEGRLEALRAQNEMSGPVFKMANDPRITKVGRFLRRTSLDEFPQFWNVLKGEMSIVGPRPPIPSEVRQYKRWQRRRLSMKPGITCIWQISGRNNIDFDRWMDLDLQYIDEWSLWRDIEICLKTIPAVLSARGAR